MARGVTFTPGAVQRIRDVVRQVERTRPSASGKSARFVTAVRRTSELVKVTGAASGGGKYNGTIWFYPESDVSESGNLTEADLGIAGPEILILNTQEVGEATHDLATSGRLPLLFVGHLRRVNADGTRVYAIDGDQWEDCT